MSGKSLYINQELIGEKTADIEKSIALLNKIALTERKKFLEDQIILSAAKYQLVLAIEAAQSICNHLAARVAKEAPESYADCFRILGKCGIITRELAAKLASMAKFRNLLVHRYDKIDDEIVYDILKNNTGDLLEYTDGIKTFLKTYLDGADRHGKEKAPAPGRGKKKD